MKKRVNIFVHLTISCWIFSEPSCYGMDIKKEPSALSMLPKPVVLYIANLTNDLTTAHSWLSITKKHLSYRSCYFDAILKEKHGSFLGRKFGTLPKFECQVTHFFNFLNKEKKHFKKYLFRSFKDIEIKDMTFFASKENKLGAIKKYIIENFDIFGKLENFCTQKNSIKYKNNDDCNSNPFKLYKKFNNFSYRSLCSEELIRKMSDKIKIEAVWTRFYEKKIFHTAELRGIADHDKEGHISFFTEKDWLEHCKKKPYEIQMKSSFEASDVLMFLNQANKFQFLMNTFGCFFSIKLICTLKSFFRYSSDKYHKKTKEQDLKTRLDYLVENIDWWKYRFIKENKSPDFFKNFIFDKHQIDIEKIDARNLGKMIKQSQNKRVDDVEIFLENLTQSWEFFLNKNQKKKSEGVSFCPLERYRKQMPLKDINNEIISFLSKVSQSQTRSFEKKVDQFKLKRTINEWESDDRTLFDLFMQEEKIFTTSEKKMNTEFFKKIEIYLSKKERLIRDSSSNQNEIDLFILELNKSWNDFLKKQENYGCFEKQIDNLRIVIRAWRSVSFLKFLGFEEKTINEISPKKLRKAVKKTKEKHMIKDNIDDINNLFKIFSEKNNNIDISYPLDFYKSIKHFNPLNFYKSDKSLNYDWLSRKVSKNVNQFLYGLLDKQAILSKTFFYQDFFTKKIHKKIVLSAEIENFYNYKKEPKD